MKNLERAIWYTLIVGSMYFGGKSIQSQGEWERLRRDVAISVDTDNNRVYTQNEWATVYRSLGLENTRKEGTDLNSEQFRAYLSDKGKKK